jgi:DNA-binding MarR family transcriptional regulator
MRILKGKHPEQMCVRDIASRMLEKNSNVPRIIDRLVAKKMVKRENSTEDKRETLISLTAKGMEQLDKVSKQVETKSNDIINLSDEEANQLHNLLEKLREEEK